MGLAKENNKVECPLSSPISEKQVHIRSEVEYCTSAASMLAEDIWQIAEGFVEVPTNLEAQLGGHAKKWPN